jgi:hypothetical protein
MNFHYECFFCHPFVAKFYMISLVIYWTTAQYDAI